MISTISGGPPPPEPNSGGLAFSACLTVTAVAGELDAVEVTYRHDAEMAGPVTLALPVHQLARTGFEKSLRQKDTPDLAAAAHEYGLILRKALSDVLEAPVAEDPRAPLLIVVTGPPHVHRWMWETVRVLAPRSKSSVPRVAVVHMPDEPLVDLLQAFVPPAPVTGRVIWIGARPRGEADLPRYLVLGPVARWILETRSGLRFAAARSTATEAEMRALVSPTSAPTNLTLCHLDAHGSSRLRVGGSDRLTVPEFAFELHSGTTDGSESAKADSALVADRLLAEALREVGCDLFMTNACFGAQQRGLMDFPFPAQLIRQGRRLVVAAREPIQGRAAAVFFDALYEQLAMGRTVLEAYTEAGTRLIRSALSPPKGEPLPVTAWDLAARWAVQPVLWAGSTEDLGIRFAPGSDPPPAAGAGPTTEGVEYLATAGVGGEVATALAAVEDAAWDGHSCRLVSSGHSCDLSAASIESLDGLARLLFVPSPGQAEELTYAVGTLEEDERLSLITPRFSGEPALLELLSHLVPGDVTYLNALAADSDGNAAWALLRALSFGPHPVGAPRDQAMRASELLEHLWPPTEGFVPPRTRLAAMLSGRTQAEIAQQVLYTGTALNLALPLLGYQINTISAAPVPQFCWGSSEAFLSLVRTKAVAVAAVGEKAAYSLAFPWIQLAVRQTLSPLDVGMFWASTLRRASDSPDNTESDEAEFDADVARWTTGTKLACLSWLAHAVAARQIGLINSRVLRWGLHIVSALSRGAALALLERFHQGLPEWQPLEEPARTEYEQLTDEWERWDRDPQDRMDRNPHDNLEDLSQVAEYAVSLLHRGQSGKVLEITDPLVAERHGELDLNLIKLHAYALARQGRLPEAMTSVAPLIARMGRLDLWDQCELLHLLGELSEHQGRQERAVRYFLEERALNPPALHRRLHNRHHLYTALHACPSADRGLTLDTALEGLELARQAENTKLVVFLAEEAVAISYRGDGWRARLARVLDAVGDDPALRSSRRVALGRALYNLQSDGDHPTETELLRELAAGRDEVAAEASQVLGQLEGIPLDERTAVLRAGANLETGSSSGCAALLLGLLWQQGDFEALAELAGLGEVREDFRAASHLALARVAHAESDIPGAIEHLARGNALTDVASLARSLSVDLDFLTDEVVEQAEQRTGELLVEQVKHLLGSNEGEPPLPGVSLVEALDGISQYESAPDVPLHLSIENILRWASERAWDRGELKSAAVARHHLCDLLARAGPQRRGDWAYELSWLATLLKQQGRVGEAETLFQQAAESGREVLDALLHANVIGRYGNLLHQIGEYEAAVHVQWQAVRALRPEMGLPERPAEMDADALSAALAPRGNGYEETVQWAQLVTNLTNCLKDAGHIVLASVASARAGEALVYALPYVQDPEHDATFSEVERTWNQLMAQFRALAARLRAASGQSVDRP
ncbi:tetratricopeptide repeat protein [Nonomuraea sp. SYSU D8015]|uniref:tetratricopeptide repeat protein n=1 Tax=Nonomuraea sp. SYSU D8015 TaxID=2593644 RepID=UPI0016610378|nr:tetratricopeptide repeat protein [Nonomuraea sp. SYSU D8015]